MKVIILVLLIAFGITPSFSEDILNPATASGLPSLRAAAKPKAATDSDEEEKEESSPLDPAQLTTRTYAAVRSACEAFANLNSEKELSGIMELTLTQISNDPELMKNAQFDHYKKTLLDVIPQIALDIQRYIKRAFPPRYLKEAQAVDMSLEAYFELCIRELPIRKIHSVWEKVIDDLETAPTVSSKAFGGSGLAVKPETVTGFDGSDKRKGWIGCFDNRRWGSRVTHAGGKSACEAMEIRILESDVTRAKIKSACEAFEKLISEDSLSGIMQLTLKQISDDSELTKNPQFDGYKNTLLDVIPQIALELLASPNQQFREKFNQFIREDISLISIYTTWKKIIEETEME